MTPEQIKELKKGIIMTAAYYGRDLKPEVVAMMADDLIDLPFDDVSKAYSDYRKDPKNRTMPLPAQIRDIVQPASTPESDGREGAARITQTIVKFGWANPTDARNFLGEHVWSVVESFGGWNYICTNHGMSIDPGAFHAQARERIIDVHRQTPRARHLELAAPEPGEMIEQSKIDKERVRQVQELLKHGGI